MEKLLNEGQSIREWEAYWNGVRARITEVRNTIDSFKQELKEEESKK